jgi:hypothetical protein
LLLRASTEQATRADGWKEVRRTKAAELRDKESACAGKQAGPGKAETLPKRRRCEKRTAGS